MEGSKGAFTLTYYIFEFSIKDPLTPYKFISRNIYYNYYLSEYFQ